MTITWGQNTVSTFTTGTPAAPAAGTPAFGSAPAPSAFGQPSPAPAFGQPAPAPSLFGTPAPTTGGNLFGGSTPAPGGAFGSAPAPAGSSLFGNPPAPGGSLFGSTPAPATGGLFGAAPAPAAGSLFGSPAPATGGLFGAPAPSSFGTGFGTTSAFGQQQPAQPQVPAQAALQAHMDASNRQEAQKIRAALEKLHSGYLGGVTSDPDNQNRFVSVVYSELTQEHRQQQWLHGMSSGTMIPVPPPRPPQVSDREWTLAVVKNPDPLNYMPQALVGAEALNARVVWQQARATQLAKDAAVIQTSHDTAQQMWAQGHGRLEQIQLAHTNHRKRLLDVMRKIELCRCMNQPLQPDEVRVVKRLESLERQVREVQRLLGELEGPLKVAPRRTEPPREFLLPDKTTLAKILKGHREEITDITATIRKDMRDLNLIRGQLAPRGSAEGGRHLALPY